MEGCVTAIFFMLFWLALGAVLSWVLTYFGVFVPWYVCGVAIWLFVLLMRYVKS